MTLSTTVYATTAPSSSQTKQGRSTPSRVIHPDPWQLGHDIVPAITLPAYAGNFQSSETQIVDS